MRNKDLFSVEYFKIRYNKVYNLLNSLGIKTLSVFIDEGVKYTFYRLLSVDDFMENMPQLNESTLIFDGELYQCETNRETENLADRKIMVGFDIGESFTCILINAKNAGVSKDGVKQILAR